MHISNVNPCKSRRAALFVKDSSVLKCMCWHVRDHPNLSFSAPFFNLHHLLERDDTARSISQVNLFLLVCLGLYLQLVSSHDNTQ